MENLKKYLFKNFEPIFILIILISVAFINYYVPYKLAFLNFYFLPVLLLAYYLDVRRAFTGAVLCFVLVGVYFYMDPQSFYPGKSDMDLVLNLVTWGGFLILSAALVGSLNNKLQKEIRQAAALHKELTASQSQAAETNKMLGLLFQGQGMLEIAFDKFRLCPLDEQIKELIYNLALDFERKREYAKAISTYEYIAKSDPTYRDIQIKQKVLQHASHGTTLPVGVVGQNDTKPAVGQVAKPKIGRYEVEKELGRGAMGIVYQARDPKINRTVALKTLKLETGTDLAAHKEITDRFFREAESAGTLSHQNIVRIFDVGEDRDICFIAEEFLEGHDLTRYTRPDSLLPAPQILEYMTQVADALDYAHGQGVIHRDIKPANLMLIKDDAIRVVDFGIAHMGSSSMTATGALMGSPAYMSPEQIAGKKLDGRSDIFSLGVVFFQLLTGKKPFEDTGDMTAVFFQITSAPEPEPTEINPKVPPCASEIVHKALKKDPVERYQRASQMAADLRSCAAALRRPVNPFEQRMKVKLEQIQREIPAWIARGGSAQVLQAKATEFKQFVQLERQPEAEKAMDEILATIQSDPSSVRG